MASARREFSPCYSRDDFTLGPVLEEISPHPNFSSSSSTSAADAELPAVFQLFKKNIDSERTILDSSRVSPNQSRASIETATPATAYLIAALHAGLDRHIKYCGLAMEQLCHPECSSSPPSGMGLNHGTQ